MIAVGAVVAGTGTIVVLAAVGGSGHERNRPALSILRGSQTKVEANLRPIARTVAVRVERLRGLRFERRPRVVVMSERRLAAVGRSLVRRERRRAQLHPSRLQASQRLERAGIELDQLAGLLPPESAFGPDTKTTGLDRIGGAFDYPRDRIIIVPELIQSRVQLLYTLAHEMTHALENQHFDLELGRLTAPSEAAEVRRAVIEGTATFVQDLYRRRYLRDNVPVARRIDAMRSVIGAEQTPYAVSAQLVFDYVDGGLFVNSLYRRADGFRLVNRALRHPPRRSDQILHPRTWPGSGGGHPRVRLGVAPRLRPDWEPVGGGTAGEERALAILVAGAFGTQATAGASGWDGGRFTVWRPRDAGTECGSGCATGNVGVIAFRWRHRDDAEQFAVGVPAYMTLGLLAENLTRERLWKVADGYVGLGTAGRASALAFAPTEGLALALSRRGATVAARRAGRVRGQGRGRQPPRHPGCAARDRCGI
jgi:hypothetical protein